jgi:hypothetical protein
VLPVECDPATVKREGMFLDLNTLLRDNLQVRVWETARERAFECTDTAQELRIRVLGGKKSEPHLFRLGDEFLNMNLAMSRQCVVEGIAHDS